MTEIEATPDVKGSWTSTVVVILIIVMKWILQGEGNTPVSLRRWGQMKKLQMKKKMGFRDGSKYKMGAGDGANQRHKRQG